MGALAHEEIAGLRGSCDHVVRAQPHSRRTHRGRPSAALVGDADFTHSICLGDGKSQGGRREWNMVDRTRDIVICRPGYC